MSGRAMNKKCLILIPSLLLAACNSQPTQPDLSAAPLAGAAIGGDFTLTDQDGSRRSYREFTGKYRIVYFGYTSCPDICTPDMQNLMAGMRLWEKSNPALAAKLQPLFITVDPGHDTPVILKQFVRAFHPRLIGLTGSENEIADAAKKFAIFYNRVEGSQLFSHSQTPYLMGPDGKPLALLPADSPQTPDQNEGDPKAVASELSKWVR